MTIGRRIRRRRMELGLSQVELAEKMGYQSHGVISLIESDKRDITWENVCKYAKVLDCSPAYLMKWEDQINDEDLELLEEVYADSVFRIKLMNYATKLKELLDAEKELTNAEDAQTT